VAQARKQQILDLKTRKFYCEAVQVLKHSGIPFLVGGAYAFDLYTGIERHTKDFDVVVQPHDAHGVLEAFAGAGYRTELPYPHWLGKAHCSDDFVDVIYSTGNGVAQVDDLWFAHARDGHVLGQAVKLCPPAEMIWSKAYVQERERYDGADVIHLVRSCAADLDWTRQVARFGAHWRVLLAHLVLFGFVYPADRTQIPAQVLRDLMAHLEVELDNAPAQGGWVQGTLLSREQYLADIEHDGVADARTLPGGPMRPEDVGVWTEAIQG
jgi:hypothetical protein